jgi:hypothetical protein
VGDRELVPVKGRLNVAWRAGWLLLIATFFRVQVHSKLDFWHANLGIRFVIRAHQLPSAGHVHGIICPNS